MNAPLKTDALPQWNLGDLYAGRDDPKIEADIALAKADNDALVALEALDEVRGRPLAFPVISDRGVAELGWA